MMVTFCRRTINLPADEFEIQQQQPTLQPPHSSKQNGEYQYKYKNWAKKVYKTKRQLKNQEKEGRNEEIVHFNANCYNPIEEVARNSKVRQPNMKTAIPTVPNTARAAVDFDYSYATSAREHTFNTKINQPLTVSKRIHDVAAFVMRGTCERFGICDRNVTTRVCSTNNDEYGRKCSIKTPPCLGINSFNCDEFSACRHHTDRSLQYRDTTKPLSCCPNSSSLYYYCRYYNFCCRRKCASNEQHNIRNSSKILPKEIQEVRKYKKVQVTNQLTHTRLSKKSSATTLTARTTTPALTTSALYNLRRVLWWVWLLVFALIIKESSAVPQSRMPQSNDKSFELSPLDLEPPTRFVYTSVIGNNVAFPRRRTADGTSQMQSRAVDTRVQFDVLENQPRGTVVGYIPTRPDFTYRFNEPPREFILDQLTGEIKTNMILDREGMQERYDLVVLSSQPTYPIEVRITVLDVNDNAPQFPEPSITVTFSESASKGTTCLLDAATDLDVGINGVSNDYRIVDGNVNEKFRLAVTTNPSGDVTYLYLETTGDLDRETRGFYKLNISARDGGSPPKYGFLQVNVSVIDVNDNPPTFDHSDYTVSLNESVPPGTSVLQVHATDRDLGDNSKVTYYLAETENQFTVDPESGVISTTEHLNCPQQTCPPTTKPNEACPKSCVFTVFARDHGSPRQNGRAYVTVNLVDTNDHDPVIKFQYFPPTGLCATVDENAVNGSVVAAVSVVDIDEGLNGETSLRIISGNELNHFRLEKTPSFDIVRVNGVLDREEISKYNLTVVASDKGTPSRTATAYLIIHVNDVNDHEPVFEKTEYLAVLSESALPGSYVVSITATDEDSGVNAQIFYDFVSGNNNEWFKIDSESGLITTQLQLDREMEGSIELSISARDGGPNPKWAYTTLKVTILDENDEAPQFAQTQINVTLSEATPPHTLIAMLTAADHDQGTNGSVTYSLATSVERKYPQQFLLDSLTGHLTTQRSLDRETQARYEILVIARDQGAPPQSSTATIYLHVEDVNDNSPVFYPRHYFHALTFDTEDVNNINENINNNNNNNNKNKALVNALLKVTATDRDEGDNALITYNLESGSDGLFTIDSWTGAISLGSSISSSGGDISRQFTKPLYKLHISAMDRGERRSEQDAIVEIILQSKLEALEFDSYTQAYEFQIVEDHGVSDQQPQHQQQQHPITHSLSPAQLGRQVGRVQVKQQHTTGSSISSSSLSSPSSSSSSSFSSLSSINVDYAIVYGDVDENFSIDKRTGLITTAKYIDREHRAQYQLEVVARKGLAYGKCLVHVSIIDINDNAPIFVQDRDDEILLPENTAVGQEVYLSRARDRDSGNNSRVTYSLTYNPDMLFRIGPSTGVVYLEKSLIGRVKAGAIVPLELTATDGGKPNLSTKYSVTLTIKDVNDHTPTFDHTSYETSLSESTRVNERFFSVAALDGDMGVNALLSYEITEGNVDQKFGIFPDGYLYVKHLLDREVRDYYALTVKCHDAGVPVLSATTVVLIHIIHDNQTADSVIIGKQTTLNDDASNIKVKSNYTSVPTLAASTEDSHNAIYSFNHNELLKQGKEIASAAWNLPKSHILVFFYVPMIFLSP